MLRGQTLNVENFIVGEVRKIRSDKFHYPNQSSSCKYVVHCGNN
jgi:hypothetical protein